MSDKRADTIYMAKVQEQTERYDGMKDLFFIFVDLFDSKLLLFCIPMQP